MDNSKRNAANTSNELEDTLKDLLDKLFTQKSFHPTLEEQGLYYADAAAKNSACLSRQVGAAILDPKGNLLSTGRNDVPKFQGGLYTNDDNENLESRCFLKGFCSNNRRKASLSSEILEIIEHECKEFDTQTLSDKIQNKLKPLIEFSRSIHAEMDALLALVRSGTQLPLGSTLYTTTYPCHSCARHIVAAGIDRVVYLEPYKKSLAIELHGDSISDCSVSEKEEEKVKFEPYVGVAPRKFVKIYKMRGERKTENGEVLSEEAGRGLRIKLSTKSFTDLEEKCKDFTQNTPK